MDDKMLQQLMILDEKERLLSEIIVWLKSKGYFEECMSCVRSVNPVEVKG